MPSLGPLLIGVISFMLASSARQAAPPLRPWAPLRDRVALSSLSGLPSNSGQVKSAPSLASTYMDVAWSHDGGRLCFSVMKASNMTDMSIDVYSMDADGSHVVNLTHDGGINSYASWAPDDTRIVFGSNRGRASQKQSIEVMNADGSHRTQLSSPSADNATPAWSPDGSRIAFVSDRDGHFQVYTMRSDGTDQIRLSHDDTRDFNPQWSPDSTRLVYYADNGDRHDQVWVMNADGSQPQRLTGGTGHNLFPAWIPDGRRIIFTAMRGDDTRTHIYTMKPDGSDLRRLSDQEAFFASSSPDGARVAFTIWRAPESAVFVMMSDGTHVQRLTK